MTKIYFQEFIPTTLDSTNMKVYTYGKSCSFEASYLINKVYNNENQTIGESNYDMKTQILSGDNVGFTVTFQCIRNIVQHNENFYIYSIGKMQYRFDQDENLELIHYNEVIQNISFCGQNIINAKIKSILSEDKTKILSKISF